MSNFHIVSLSKKWNKILEEVHEVSLQSNMTIRLGSVLLEKGKIIKSGCNSNTRSAWHGITMPGIHAEMKATHHISPYTRPPTYRRLWSSSELESSNSSDNKSITNPISSTARKCYQQLQYEKGNYSSQEN